eukprot:242841-Pleurochrysis_carterae.AAC.1
MQQSSRLSSVVILVVIPVFSTPYPGSECFLSRFSSRVFAALSRFIRPPIPVINACYPGFVLLP